MKLLSYFIPKAKKDVCEETINKHEVSTEVNAPWTESLK